MKSLRINQLILGMAAAATVLVATSCQDELTDAQPKGEGAAAQAVITLSGEMNTTAELNWTNNNTYILDGFVTVPSGSTLSIQEGTVIRGVTGTLAGDPASGTVPGTLIIERGAMIDAVGTASQPIVFTSNESSPAIGDWGGVIILGNAPVCFNGDPLIEGIPDDFGVDRGYGGSNAADNSGSFQYVRIEYAGNVLVDGDETNGLTLGGVGSGTTIDHVQVTYGADDAFEFFGGTVNASYLIASFNTDDDFDTDQGYSGHIQFAVSLRDPNIFSSSPTGSLESNGDDDDDDGCDLTNATFSNVTVIGPISYNNSTTTMNPAYNSGALIRDGSELDIFNSIIVGYPNYQLQLEAPAAFGSTVFAEGVTLVYPTYGVQNAQGTNASFTGTGLNNESLEATSVVATNAFSMVRRSGLSTSAWNLSSPSFVPVTEKAADFSSSLLSGFTVVDFRGAFGLGSDAAEGTNWNLGWENF